MMRCRIRLLVTLALGLLVAPLTAEAQPASRLPRIGFLGNSTAALEANLVGPFRDGLRDLGYVEGENILLEYRWAEGKYERFPELISDLIRLHVAIIVTAGTPASLAVKKATTSIPLVMMAVGDPVGTGLIASLARPGGNVTGISAMAADLEGKRLELLREVVPTLSHVAVLWNPTNPFQWWPHKRSRPRPRRCASTCSPWACTLRSSSTMRLRPFVANSQRRSMSWRIASSSTTAAASWTSLSTRACRGCMRTAS